MWSVSDEALLAGLASGDPESAAALIRRFQGRVFGLALAIVGDPAAAEDVAQETFFRAWRHAGAYDPRRGRVSTWLLSIARNTAVDAIRVRRAEPLDPESIATLLPPAAGPSPEERGSAAGHPAQIKEALRSLPVEQ